MRGLFVAIQRSLSMKLTITTLPYLVVTLATLFVGGALANSWIRTEKEIARETDFSGISSDVRSGPDSSEDAQVAHVSTGSQGAPQREGEVHSESQHAAQSPDAVGASTTSTARGSTASVILAPTRPFVPQNSGGINSASKEMPEAILNKPATASLHSAASASVASGSQTPLGAKPLSVASSPAPASSAGQIVPVAIPAAFGNPAAAGITTPEQSQQVAQIANGFTAAVQSSGAAPNTPAYQQAWNTAIMQANQLFKQQYGTAAFEVMQRSANSQ